MSYVLDALRRAEAERQRGSVPGLHAQSGPAPQARESTDARPRWWLPAAGVLLLAGVAGAVWWAWPAPATAPAPTPAPPRTVGVAPPVSAPPPLINLPAPPVAPRPAPPPVRPTPAPTPAAAGQVPKLQELPEMLRRQIPPMAFGGATDSTEASARMLIINGQIWREGDELAPGLKLERIALRGAIFRFREQRFELSY